MLSQIEFIVKRNFTKRNISLLLVLPRLYRACCWGGVLPSNISMQVVRKGLQVALGPMYQLLFGVYYQGYTELVVGVGYGNPIYHLCKS